MTSAVMPAAAPAAPFQPAATRKAPTSKVDNVQYLRALAAVVVVVSHVTINLSKSLGTVLPLPLPGPFGVEIFFVISGFIITHTSMSRFGRPGAALAFANHRFWRVAPLYWVVTTVYLAISFAAPDLIYKGYTSVAHTLASYVFLPWPNANGSMDPIYVAGWSLNYEMFFYTLFTLVLWLPWRMGLAVVVGALGVLAALHTRFPARTALDVWSRPYLWEFLVGVGLALFRRSTGPRAPFAVMGPAVAFLLLTGVFLFHRGWAYPNAEPATIALAGSIVGVAVLCRDAVRRGPALRFVAALGDSSYSLYLFHMFAVRLVIKALEAAHVLRALPWWMDAAAAVGGALVLGWASYRGLELGLIPAVRRAIEGHRPSPTVSPA